MPTDKQHCIDGRTAAKSFPSGPQRNPIFQPWLWDCLKLPISNKSANISVVFWSMQNKYRSLFCNSGYFAGILMSYLYSVNDVERGGKNGTEVSSARPASNNKTDAPASSESREATTQPELPAPTTMTSLKKGVSAEAY
jgi:hypothetical protein